MNDNKINDPESGSGQEEFYTGQQLLDMNVTDLPYLVEGLFPKYGLVCVGGSSDTGKSRLARQLATSIVLGKGEFLGFKMIPEHRSAIYISTEDDRHAAAFLLKQANGNLQSKYLERLLFLFDTENLIQKISKILATTKVDAIIMDTFADIFTGDMNSANKVRVYLHEFKLLVERFNCLIVFLHHTGKRTEDKIPSKSNLNGSQGLESKMRLVIEFRKDQSDPSLRHVCIVKGNYVDDKEKDQSYQLKFDNWEYRNTGKRVPFRDLIGGGKSKSRFEGDIKERINSLSDQGLSVRQVWKKLIQDDITISRGTVGEIIKNRPAVQKPSGKMDVGQFKAEVDDTFDDEDLID